MQGPMRYLVWMGVGQTVIFSQPREDRGATMEEGKVQMTADFLSDNATIILFFRRNSSVR